MMTMPWRGSRLAQGFWYHKFYKSSYVYDFVRPKDLNLMLSELMSALADSAKTILFLFSKGLSKFW